MTYRVEFPKVNLNEGYELTGWNIVGAETVTWGPETWMIEDVQNYANGYNLTVEAVIEKIEDEKPEETYHVIHVSFYDADSTTYLGGGDVISTYPDQEVGSIPVPTAPEGMTFVGWKAMLGNSPMYTGGFTFTELEALRTELDGPITWYNDEETWVSFVAVYEDEGPDVQEYTITATAGRHGSISPSGEVTVAEGEDQTFTITPDSGYRVYRVLVDGVNVGAVTTYTFEDISADHTIEVTFRAKSTSGGTTGGNTGGGSTVTDDDDKDVVDDTDDDTTTGVADPDDTGVSSWLNTENHFAYLSGYPGDLFGPDDNMTRAEVAQMFYNLLLDKNVTTTVTFSDVAADAWYADAVNALASLGIITGVGNNQFDPERAITRAEFTTIAMRFAELPTGGSNIFSDVSRSDWYYDYVVGAIQYGWITGYVDGTFRPDNTILRSEVTAIVNRMLGRSADEDYVDSNQENLVQFTDLSTGHWAYYDITEATNAHDYTRADNAEDWIGLN